MISKKTGMIFSISMITNVSKICKKSANKWVNNKYTL